MRDDFVIGTARERAPALETATGPLKAAVKVRTDTKNHVDDRHSPIHAAVAQQGAVFGESTGWKYPLWFRSGDDHRAACARAEHRATRTGVGVFDISLLSTFEVKGTEAARVLNWVCTNQIDVSVGKAVYTAVCDEAGIVSCDVVVIRRSADAFLVVGTDTVQSALFENLVDASAGFDATVRDTTGDTAIVAVQGPKSRALLNRLTGADLSIEAFPYLSAQMISVAGVEALAVRVTFTGDCGWELHVPANTAHQVYQSVFAAGAALGVRACGMDAIYSLGAEKGYLDTDVHIPAGLTPMEVGLGFTIDWKKEHGFQGSDALAALRSRPLTKRLVLLRSTSPVREGDTLLRNGSPSGVVSWAAYGETLEAHVGYALVHCDLFAEPAGITEEWLQTRQWSTGDGSLLEVGTTPWLDPERARILV